jgi:NAD(P)H-nitrite reductase large subunit
VEIPRFERCYCTGVVRSEAVAALRANRCRTVDELRRACGACFGCQTCRPELEQLIKEEWENADKPTDRVEKGG